MKSKIAIISLLKKRNNNWAHIYERNKLILRNIGLYDMLIFDEGVFKKNDFFELSKTYPQIIFVDISKDWKKRTFRNFFSRNNGFKNMCSFFAIKVSVENKTVLAITF